jgi:hypothetical protein
MNFVAGFMLITNGGNDEEAFWLFKRLAESPEFLATGLFEVPKYGPARSDSHSQIS